MLLAGLVAVVLATYTPTAFSLAAGPWQTEQEGHGPFVLAIAAWAVWRRRADLMRAPFIPAPLVAWPLLAAGMMLLFLGRSQQMYAIETGSLLPVLAGTVLLIGGWEILKVLKFPIGILFFAVPPPGWLLDAMTLPLKAWISDVVTRLLYHLGYPIAQNGVVILVGPYQLLVKDACAGMNSIFALSAIGFVYLYITEHASNARKALLLLAILPITIIANFLRVLGLVLTAYYFGSDAIEGLVHDLTGLALFAIAFMLMVAFDESVGLVMSLSRRVGRRRAAVEV